MKGIDTNIFVYAFDQAYEDKRKICKDIILDIFNGKNKGVVTNQILAEFAFIVTKKIERPLSIDDVKSIIGAILSSENWEVYNYNANTVFNSLENTKSFWDSLITQTLKENNVKKIITENVKDFENSGLEVINPLK